MKLALTGTPIETGPRDLLAIIKACQRPEWESEGSVVVYDLETDKLEQEIPESKFLCCTSEKLIEYESTYTEALKERRKESKDPVKKQANEELIKSALDGLRLITERLVMRRTTDSKWKVDNHRIKELPDHHTRDLVCRTEGHYAARLMDMYMRSGRAIQDAYEKKEEAYIARSSFATSTLSWSVDDIPPVVVSSR